MVSIEILIILFKKTFETSETLQSLLANTVFLDKRNKLTIWDNSPNSLQTKEVNAIRSSFSPCEVEYISTNNNSKLSYIYNTIRKKTDRDFLVLLDHDTCLPTNFIKIVDESVNDSQNSDINLFLPVLFSDSNIISPAYEYKFTTKMWTVPSYGRMISDNLQALNSGMIIRTSYFKYVFEGYNENLAFYGTDNFFMKKYRKNNPYLFILPIDIIHHSNFREDDLISRARRFMAIKNAAVINAKDEGKFYVLFERFRMLYMAFKYCISNNTILFLKGYFNLL